MTVFVDTNVLVYSFSDNLRREPAQAVLEKSPHTSVQALNELVNALRKKLKVDDATAFDASATVRELCAAIHPIDPADHVRAIELLRRYRLQWWDAILVATALRVGASTFLSEDLHHGLVIDDQLTIANPFRA